jgi:protein-tyrosine phosphatase
LSTYWINAGEFRLAIATRPRGGDWLAGDIESLKNEGVAAVVSALTDAEAEELGLEREPDCCLERELDYFSFPIEDRSVPDSVEEFRSLIADLLDELVEGRAVVIHCRAGIGRSSMIASGVLMRLGSSASEALRIVGEARGMTVPDTTEQREWLERLNTRAQSD